MDCEIARLSDRASVAQGTDEEKPTKMYVHRG